MRKPERTVVHRNHPAGFQIHERLGRVARIGMHIAELRWIVGSNRQQREFRCQSPPDLAESREVRRVARVIDGVLARPQHEAAIAAMGILQNSRSPMPGRHMGDRQIRLARAVPPVEFDDLGEPQVRHQIGNMAGDNDRWRRPTLVQIVLHDRPQRGPMQMIKVGVRHQHQIDGWKIAHAQPGTAQALQHKQPAGKVGIDSNALPTDLQKEARVADESDAKFPVGDKPRLVGLTAPWSHY